MNEYEISINFNCIVVFVSCYTGVPGMSTYSPSPGIKKGEVIYYNATGGEEGVKTYFHGGEVTTCITTSSTVTCY